MKKIFALCILSVATMLALTGCWGSGSPQATASPSPSPSATAMPSTAPSGSDSIASGSLWNEGDSASTDMAASGGTATNSGSVAGSGASSGAGSMAGSGSATK